MIRPLGPEDLVRVYGELRRDLWSEKMNRLTREANDYPQLGAVHVAMSEKGCFHHSGIFNHDCEGCIVLLLRAANHFERTHREATP